jgi:uncharacterized membrane protein YgaE (UPF0421/DUF939 family)
MEDGGQITFSSSYSVVYFVLFGFFIFLSVLLVFFFAALFLHWPAHNGAADGKMT